VKPVARWVTPESGTRLSVALAVFAALATACDQKAPTPTPDADVPRLTGTVDLMIGDGDDATEEYQFEQVRGMAFAPGGRIVVADGASKSVRAYDSTGRFLFRIGREGGGPGEMTSPAAMTIGPDSLLWVRDEGNSRWNAFRLDADKATFIRDIVRQARIRGGNTPIVFDSAGGLIDVYPGWTNDDRTFIARSIIAPDGRRLSTDTIWAPPADSVRELSFTAKGSDGSEMTNSFPFGPQVLGAHARTGDYALAISSRYEIDWRNSRGEPLQRITRTVAPIELTATERKHFDEATAFAAKEMKLSSLPFDTPKTKAPLTGLFFDATGRLWVLRDAPQGSPPEADIYDRSGRLVAIAAMPKDAVEPLTPRTGALAEREMLTISHDTLGVTRIARIRFRQ
jgi:hypothetical protein